MSHKFNVLDTVAKVQPTANSVRPPKIPGSLNSVFIAKSGTNGHETVFKFNHRDMAIKNAIVAEILNDNGVPAPRINLYSDGAQWCEVYPLIPGRTLYECVNDGMSNQAIDAVYNELLELFRRMSKIDWRAVENIHGIHTHQVARTNITDVNNRAIAYLFSGAVRAVNNGDIRERGLYHCGITPKNVIIGPGGYVAGLIDMDEVAIADKNYAFGMMAAKYQQLRGQTTPLINHYQELSGQILRHRSINAISRATNISKAVMWHMAHFGVRSK